MPALPRTCDLLACSRAPLAALALLSTLSAGLVACSHASDASTQALPPPPPALADTAGASIAELCDGTQARRWELVDADGQALATTQGNCMPSESAQAPGPYVAVSQLLSDERARYEFRMWFDTKGQPIHAQLREPSSTRYYAWTEAALIETHLGDSREQTREQNAPMTWVVPSHAIYVRELMVRMGVGHDPARPGSLRQRSFAPDRERISEFDLHPTRGQADQAPTLPLGDGHFNLPAEASALAHLSLGDFLNADGQAVYRHVKAPLQLDELLPELPQPSYRMGADLRARPLQIPAVGEDPQLGAELVLADDGATTKRPGVLFISGAGAQDRHGIVPGAGIDVGSHEIHDGLARAGFAVLRMDDRGVGESQIGEDATPGFLAGLRDARRALEVLAKSPEVDPTRLVVIGHGEGALLASLLAQDKVRVGRKKHKLAAAVLLAAPGRNVRELVYDEIRRSLAARDEFTREAAVQDAMKIHAAALAGEDLPASSEPLREWMQEIFLIEPAAEIAKLRLPVLALHGDKDFQVDPQRDFEAVREALAVKGASKSNQAERLAQLDHLFKPEPGKSHAGHYRDLSRHVDPALVQKLSDWLTTVLAQS